ncbi:nuclear transport factor 2 family protein [Agrobacterium sp. NPDC090273]|uniref:nuclear transport factor 2 family protein n=1 Tax=Agrobacterium sp. NPDC090273 TaxID=3363919 RepID=UPI00383A75BE
MTKNEALEADQKRIQACLNADVDMLDVMMADGCLYIHTAGNIDTKTDFIAKVKDGRLRYLDIRNAVESVATCGDAVAIAGVLDMIVLRAGVQADLHIRYCCNWVKTASGPKMLTWQATALPT